MGSIRKAIDDVTGKQDAEKIVNRLQLLLVAAKGKIRGFKDEINEQFMNPESISKTQVPGIRAMKYIEQYHIASSSKFNQQVGDHISKAVDAFFSIGGDGSTKENVKTGIKEIIKGSLDAFIGSTEAGETEERMYMIIPENNAFIRADVFLWKYHLSDSSIVNNNDTAVAYILCKSVVNHLDLTIDELIYLASDTLAKRHIYPKVQYFGVLKGDGTKNNIATKLGKLDESIVGTNLTDIDAMLTAVKTYNSVKSEAEQYKTFNKVYQSDAGGNIIKIVEGGDDEPSNWKEYLGSSSVAPSIQEVRDYIGELIRVWKKLRQAMK